MAFLATLASRVLVLGRALLPARDVRVELLLLLRREDRAHRGNLPLPRLLHLRTERLHLRPRRGRVAALTCRASVLHRLLELVVRLLGLAKVLQLGLLVSRERDALEELPARTAPAHAALALLLTLWLLRGLRRGNADGAEGKGQAEGRGHHRLAHDFISVSVNPDATRIGARASNSLRRVIPMARPAGPLVAGPCNEWRVGGMNGGR